MSRLVAPYTRTLRHSQARRQYASVTDLASLPQPGSRLHGFTLHRSKHVPELELSALHFQHDKTGAEYLHVAREDKNNVFSIGFKTNPPDATGVPHILEHVTFKHVPELELSALHFQHDKTGAEYLHVAREDKNNVFSIGFKTNPPDATGVPHILEHVTLYPVRDPFFKMLPRSLQNFMNAFTSSHYTMYPFATTNAQDFKNLMGVYLDATLHPLLKRSDFVQEGWRIGPENPRDSSDADGVRDLVFKGVVYNEMKGMTSDASYLYYVKYLEHIFPAINNSGGDPQKMTELTYEQLRNFHQEHYHPSNSKIMTYGDQPVEHHLELLGEQLSRFERSSIDPEVKQPASLHGTKTISVPGPIDPLTPSDAQYKTSTTWLFGDTADIHESFALSLASSLLLDGYGSPMYRELIEAGLGTDFSPNTGYDNSSRQAIFSVGLNGVTKENVPKVKTAIVATLQKTIDKGFDKHKVDGILHQLELGIKHKTASFGMNLIQRMNPGWFNGLDPLAGLSWNAVVDRFTSEYAKGGYLERLLKKYTATDDTLSFTMVPSEDYAAALVAEETERLQVKIAETVSGFSTEEEAHKHLRKRELELIAEQDAGQTQDLDSLPTLHVSDIPRIHEKTELRDSTMDAKTRLQWRETATNGLTYFRALSLFDNMPDELRVLIPLFCDSLMRIGTRQKSMEELEDLIKLKTGGISFGFHTSTSPNDILKSEEGFSLSGYAFDGNVSAMYELLLT
nr:mitochondrial presequence protease [Quercus suber]